MLQVGASCDLLAGFVPERSAGIESVKDYIFERQKLMNEIERRDIEQIKTSGYE